MSDDAANDLVVNALASYLENSLERENSLREILSKAGYNDPDSSVEECLVSLVKDYLRLTTA
jgi:hypothetical protein